MDVRKNRQLRTECLPINRAFISAYIASAFCWIAGQRRVPLQDVAEALGMTEQELRNADAMQIDLSAEAIARGLHQLRISQRDLDRAAFFCQDNTPAKRLKRLSEQKHAAAAAATQAVTFSDTALE